MNFPTIAETWVAIAPTQENKRTAAKEAQEWMYLLREFFPNEFNHALSAKFPVQFENLSVQDILEEYENRPEFGRHRYPAELLVKGEMLTCRCSVRALIELTPKLDPQALNRSFFHRIVELWVSGTLRRRCRGNRDDQMMMQSEFFVRGPGFGTNKYFLKSAEILGFKDMKAARRHYKNLCKKWWPREVRDAREDFWLDPTAIEFRLPGVKT